MSAIVEELTIAAAPESVFNALTQQDELARWWANEARVKPEVALLVNFAFGRRRVSFSLRRPNWTKDRTRILRRCLVAQES